MAVHSLFCGWMLLTFVVCCSNAAVLEFASQPVQRTALAGADVTLSCIVNNLETGRHAVLWYRSEVLITNNSRVVHPVSGRISVSADPTIGQYNLHISDVEPSDDHLYRCTVCDENGAVVLESDQIRLEVESTPSEEYPRCSPLEKGNFVEGENVTITCKSERANPPVALQWYQGGKRMENTLTDSKGFRTATQTFQVVSSHDKAVFQCKMTTPAIAKYEKSCTVGPLSVFYKPVVSLVSDRTVYPDGSTVRLDCQASANPEPYDYQWDAPESLLAGNVVFSQNRRTLLFRASEDLNGSKVSCNATNRYGYGISAVVSLIVTSKNNSIIDNGQELPKDPTIRDKTEKDRSILPESGASASPPKLNNFLLLLIIGILCALIISLSLVLIWTVRRNHQRSTNTSRVVYNGPFAVCNGNNIERAWDHNSIYYEPQDQVSVVYDPMWQSPPDLPRQRNVAVQVPFREDPHYAQIECDWDDDHGTLEL